MPQPSYPLKHSETRWRGLAMLLLAGLTLALYLPARTFEFTNWDDGMYITQNALIHKLTPDRILKIFSSLIFANYHPITLLSYALQYAVFGGHPAGYHWVNIILHTANVLLLFCLMDQMSGSRFLSAAAALIFGLHPLQVESVAWISSHKTLLSAFFSLVALETYWTFLKSGRKHFWGGSLLCFALAVFAKPTSVVIPFLLVGMDRLPFAAPAGAGPWRKTLLRLIPFIFLAALEWSLVFLAHLKERAIAPMAGGGWGSYSVIPLWTPFIYLKKIFWPVDLMALYPPLSNVGWNNPAYALPALLVAAGVVFAVIFRKKFPFFAGCVYGYIILLLPTANLIPLSAPIADRYLYLPLIPPVLFATGALEKLRSRGNAPTNLLSAVLALVIGSGFFAISRHELNHWRNSHALWTSVIQKAPRHAMAHVKLGEYYYEKGDIDEAIRRVSQGVSLGLNNPVFAKNLVAMYIAKGEYSLARKNALSFVLQAPGDERFYIQLGIIESKENPEKAAAYFKKATEVNPRNPFGWYHLGRFYLDHRKQPEAAYPYFLKSLALDPYQPDFHMAVADCLSQVGSYPQAINILRHVLTLDESSVDAWLNLGNLFKLNGDEEASRQALQRAYKLSPALKPAAKPARVDYSS